MSWHIWRVGAVAIACASAPAAASPQLGVALATAGISPTALAASGVSPAEAAAMLAALEGATATAALMASLGAAHEAEQALALARHEGASAGVLAAAQATLDAAKAELQARCDALIEASQLSAVQRDRLRRWRTAPAELPAQFRVSVWSEAELRNLRRALRDERLAQESQEPAPGSAAAVLAAARARPEVAEAEAGLNGHLAAITQSVDAATR